MDSERYAREAEKLVEREGRREGEGENQRVRGEREREREREWQGGRERMGGGRERRG